MVINVSTLYLRPHKLGGGDWCFILICCFNDQIGKGIFFHIFDCREKTKSKDFDDKVHKNVFLKDSSQALFVNVSTVLIKKGSDFNSNCIDNAIQDFGGLG